MGRAVQIFINRASSSLYSHIAGTSILFRKSCFSSFISSKYQVTQNEQKIDLGDDIRVNCLKIGNGPHNLLFIPGIMGTIWNDYRPQIDGFDKEMFTMVVMEQLGYGRSRPPDRECSINIHQQDAECGAKLMQELGAGTYSVLGWSQGGISAMILAAKYPSLVEKLVIWGSNSYISKKDMSTYKYFRDFNKMSAYMRNNYLWFYDLQYFEKCWENSFQTMYKIYNNHDGNLCKDDLPDIQCPTLVLHGNKDPMIDPEHPAYLLKHIKNSRLHVFEGGKHIIHHTFAEEFNRIVQEFLQEEKPI